MSLLNATKMKGRLHKKGVKRSLLLCHHFLWSCFSLYKMLVSSSVSPNKCHSTGFLIKDSEVMLGLKMIMVT